MAISGPMIIAKAKSIYENLDIDTECKFSDGWLQSFKNCYGIRQLSMSGERKLAFTGAASKFCTGFKTILEEKGFTADEIYNADETGIY